MPPLPLDQPLKLMAQIAALCSDLGAHEQALSVFRQLALVRDAHPNALVSLALAQSRAGQHAQALQTLRDALQRDPVHDMARVLLAIQLHERGDASARELLQAMLDDPRPALQRDPDALALAASVRLEILRPATPVTSPAHAAPAVSQPPAARISHLRYSRI